MPVTARAASADNRTSPTSQRSRPTNHAGGASRSHQASAAKARSRAGSRATNGREKKRSDCHASYQARNDEPRRGAKSISAPCTATIASSAKRLACALDTANAGARPRTPYRPSADYRQFCELATQVRAGVEQSSEQQQRRELGAKDCSPDSGSAIRFRCPTDSERATRHQADRGGDEPHGNRHQKRMVGHDGLLIRLERPSRQLGVLGHEHADQEGAKRQRHGEAAEHRPFQRLRPVVRQETEVEEGREEVAREHDLWSVAHVRRLRWCR